jgi:hypothetical protein
MSKNIGIMAALEEFTSELTKSASIGDNTPDGTKPATEGSRSSENTSDVKAQIVNNVDSTTAGGESPGGKNTPTNSIGTSKGETGEDVPSTKTDKEDPGTSHPAKAGAGSNRPSGGGEKSAAAIVEMANSILADIAVVTNDNEKRAAAKVEAEKKAAAAGNPGATNPSPNQAPAATKQAGAAGEPTPATTEGKPAGQPEAKPQGEQTDVEKQAAADEQLGYLAGQFLAEKLLGQDKTAGAADPQAELAKYAEAQVRDLIAKADYHSTLVSEYLTKRANGMGDPAAAPLPMDPAAAAGGDPAAAAMGGGMGGAPAPDPAAAMGGGMGGGMGGAPAPDPAAGGGGDPMGSIPPEVLQLAMAIMQSGVDPAAIMQAIQGGGGGGGAGGPAGIAMDAAGGAGGGGEGAPGGSPDVGAAAASEDGSSDNADKGGEGKGKPEGGEKEAQLRKQAAAVAKQDPRFVKLAQALNKAAQAKLAKAKK